MGTQRKTKRTHAARLGDVRGILGWSALQHTLPLHPFIHSFFFFLTGVGPRASEVGPRACPHSPRTCGIVLQSAAAGSPQARGRRPRRGARATGGSKPHRRREKAKERRPSSPEGQAQGAPRAVFRHLKGCLREEGPSLLCGLQGSNRDQAVPVTEGGSEKDDVFYQQRLREGLLGG